jgi:hypothetical protein
VLTLQALLSFALSAVLFGVKVFALVDCIARDSNAFGRAATLSKPVWMAILAVAVVFDLRYIVLAGRLSFGDPISLLGLAGTLAALVYLAQLRGSNH